MMRCRSTAAATVCTSSIDKCSRPRINASTCPHSTSACAPRGELPKRMNFFESACDSAVSGCVAITRSMA